MSTFVTTYFKRALILAAGKGERLGEATKTRPKPMIEVDGKPVLFHHLDTLKKYRLTRVCINLHAFPEVIKNAVGDGQNWDLDVEYSHEDSLRGTAGALWGFDSLFHDGEPLLVIYGDNYWEFDLEDFSLLHQGNKTLGALCTVGFHYREDVAESGIGLWDDSGKLTRFVEKPQNGEAFSHWVNAGVLALEGNFFDWVRREFSKFPLDFSRDVFPRLLSRGQLFAAPLRGWLKPIDTPQLLRNALGIR